MYQKNVMSSFYVIDPLGNVMKYRSRTEIIEMILESTRSAATRTKVMYKSYLSYAQVKEYLSFLMQCDLVTYEEGSQTYSVTEKGLRFLHVYSEIGEMVIPKATSKPIEV